MRRELTRRFKLSCSVIRKLKPSVYARGPPWDGRGDRWKLAWGLQTAPLHPESGTETLATLPVSKHMVDT